MNRKKKFFKVLAVLLCVAVVTWICPGYIVEAETHRVKDINSLLSAIRNAADGDTIVFYGEIDSINNLGSAEKHIILKRGTADSYLITQRGISGTIQNITFDGAGMKANQPILKVQGDFTVENCTFQNCGDPQNTSSSGCIGGAIQANFGSPVFRNCQFINNNAVVGGHIAIIGDAAVSFYDCTMKAGYAGSGGAISITGNARCIVEGCTITENETLDYGGGIANGGYIQIKETKLFNNRTVNGGADIANKIGGVMVLEDTLETLQTLFEADEIVVHGWVCDYDFDEGIYIPDVEPSEDNLLKLDFEYKQPEETEPSEPEQPTEPGETEQPTTPDENEPIEPGENEQPTDEPGTEPDNPTEGEKPGEGEPPPPTDNPEEKPGESDTEETPSTPSDATGDTTTNTTINSNSSTDNSNRSTNTTDNRKTDNSDNSRYSNTSDSNNNSTVNNYYSLENQPYNNGESIQTIVVPVGNAGSGEPLQQTIKIESPEGTTGNLEGMTLNVNVNIVPQEQEAAISSASEKGVSWYQVAILCLLSAIVGCLLKRR